MFNLGDKIVEAVSEWVKEVLDFILTLINNIIFKLPENSFANQVMDIFTWFTGVCAVVLVLYKVIEYIINTQNGTQTYPLDEILLRVFKSAGAIVVLPWISKEILKIAHIFANYFKDSAIDPGKDGYTIIEKYIKSGAFFTNAGGSAIVILLFLIFFLIVFIAFLFSACTFYADFLLMQVLVAPVALSMISDDNNYFQVWWRELLSQVISLLVKLFLVTLVINILFDGTGSFFETMLAIGSGILIIRTPSVLKNMWYGGGGTKGLVGGAKQGTSLAARTITSMLMK